MQKHKKINKKLFHNIVKNIPICTTDVVMFSSNRKKVLFGRRANAPLKGRYYSFGGRLLKNESFVNGAVRNAEQELNLKIKKKKLMFGGVVNEIFSNSIYSDTNYHAVNIYWGYILDIKEENKITLDGQHTSCRWFNISDKKLHPYLKERINSLCDKYDL